MGKTTLKIVDGKEVCSKKTYRIFDLATNEYARGYNGKTAWTSLNNVLNAVARKPYQKLEIHEFEQVLSSRYNPSLLFAERNVKKNIKLEREKNKEKIFTEIKNSIPWAKFADINMVREITKTFSLHPDLNQRILSLLQQYDSI